jgi:cytochrome c biogenesis protein CcdA
MTFVYFLGLLTVFLPIGLGISFVGIALREYHNLLFSLGGIFMILLGIFLLAGKQFALPSPVHPELSKYTIGSIFILGIFSAISTTCCAPVLIGVLAVSSLAGSLLLGGLYTLSYVLGMALPLFIVAMILDKTSLTKKLWMFRRSLTINFLGISWQVLISNLIAGGTFVIFGAYILYLSLTNQLLMQSDGQFKATLWLARINRMASNLANPATEYLGAGLVMVTIILIIKLSVKQFRGRGWK